MSKSIYQIAVLPGDGIGTEIIAEALKILRKVEDIFANVKFETTEFSVGAGEYLKSRNPLPERTLEDVRKFDAILLGAMGLPNVRWESGLEMTPQIDLREKLDLYCGLRPIKLYNAVHSPLKNYVAGEIDFMLVRENCEGLFAARNGRFSATDSEAKDTMLITRHGSERIIRAAFKQAGLRRQKCSLIDKANVLPSMAYLRMIFDEIATEFPEIETERIYVDAASLYLVQRPDSFDVLVTENMFGDILSDMTAGLVGGMGLAPSADIGDKYAVFQPSHGSAPDIAGKGIANPIATILSAKMMLEWLGGETNLSAAKLIRKAVEHVLNDENNRTKDLGGNISTTEMGDLISGKMSDLAE